MQCTTTESLHRTMPCELFLRHIISPFKLLHIFYSDVCAAHEFSRLPPGVSQTENISEPFSVKYEVSKSQPGLPIVITTWTTPLSLDSQNPFSAYSSNIETTFACLDSLAHTCRPRPSISIRDGVCETKSDACTVLLSHVLAQVHLPGFTMLRQAPSVTG